MNITPTFGVLAFLFISYSHSLVWEIVVRGCNSSRGGYFFKLRIFFFKKHFLLHVVGLLVRILVLCAHNFEKM